MSSLIEVRAFRDETLKVAARRGLKLIRRLASSGSSTNLARANRIATTPGVLKKTQAGSQVRHLGSGMEGVSTLTAHPKRGLEVRKIIDPKGIAGPKMVQQRESAGRALQGSSDVAQFHGAYNTPGGLRAQRYEYVSGKPASSAAPASALSAQPSTAVGTPAAKARMARGTPAPAMAQGTPSSRLSMSPEQRAQAQMKRLQLQGRQAGFDVADLHSGNVIAGAGGAGKVVDFIPVPKGTRDVGVNAANFQKAVDAQDAAAKGIRTEYLDYLEDPRRAGNIMARAFRGAPPLTPGSSTSIRQPRRAQIPSRPTPKNDLPSTAVSRPSARKATMPRPEL